MSRDHRKLDVVGTTGGKVTFETQVARQRRVPLTPEGQRPIVSPYLTSREALVYLRLKSLSALYHHIRENALPVCRAGGDLRFDTRELDAWLRGTTALELARARRQRP